MNRNKADQMPALQIQFLQNICLPLYNVSQLLKLKFLIKVCFLFAKKLNDLYRKYSEISPWPYFRENTVIKLIFNLNYFKDKNDIL
jgi:hypothetical protein